MKTFFSATYFLSIFLAVSQGEQRELWSSDLTTASSLAAWNTTLAGYLSSNRSICPDPDSNCYVSFAYHDLFRTDSTEGYCNLTLWAFVQTINLNLSNGEYCSFYLNPYTLEVSTWSVLDIFTSPTAKWRNISLPEVADDNPSVGLSIYTHSQRNDSICMVQNVSLWGSECGYNHSSRQVIWSSSLSTKTSFSEWQSDGISSITTSNVCPESPNDTTVSTPCCVVTSGAEIYRYDSTEGFANIELNVNIKPDEDSTCSLYYIVGYKSDSEYGWNHLHSINHTITGNETQFLTIPFPDYADDNQVVGVSFYVWSGECGISNVTMSGIPISTLSSPTHTPATQSQSDLIPSDTVTQILLVVMASLSILIAIIGSIDATFRKNDIFRLSSILAFVLVTADWFSDIAFVASMKGTDDVVVLILFIASLYFIVLPFFFNLWQLKRSTNEWMNDKENGSLIVDYLRKYGTMLYAMAILSGSGFAAIKLMNSGLFRWNAFDLRLKRDQISSFETKRIFSVVMLENTPQIAIHFAYAYWTGSIRRMDLITGTSSVLSALSIILSLLIYSTLKAIDRHTRNCDLYLIQFEVHDAEVTKRRKALKFQSAKMNMKMADVLSVNIERMEQLKPTNVTLGLRFTFRVRIPLLDANRSTESIDALIRRQIQRGSLASMIKDLWTLETVPVVDHLKVRKLHSAQEINGNGTEMTVAGVRSVVSASTLSMSDSGEGIPSTTASPMTPTSITSVHNES